MNTLQNYLKDGAYEMQDLLFKWTTASQVDVPLLISKKIRDSSLPYVSGLGGDILLIL